MSWRGDIRDSMLTSLEAFQSANPTLVDRIHKARPESLTDTRCIYIGEIAEAIRHTSGVRLRDATVTLMCTVHLSDNIETTDYAEDLADELVDWLTANYGLTGANTVQEPIRTATTEVPDSGTFIPAVSVVCRAQIQQGRL